MITRTRKTTLFCPGCWHESPIDGDWLRDPSTGRYDCPECGETFTTRDVPGTAGCVA